MEMSSKHSIEIQEVYNGGIEAQRKKKEKEKKRGLKKESPPLIRIQLIYKVNCRQMTIDKHLIP